MPDSPDEYGIYSLEANVSFGSGTTIAIEVGAYSSEQSNEIKHGGCDWDRSSMASVGTPDGEVGLPDFSFFRYEVSLGKAWPSEFGSLRDAYGLYGCQD
tara:strand:- start:6181 stop:6477 length:297 start_codon:yes stop_codon:yes gene_type:complete